MTNKKPITIIEMNGVLRDTNRTIFSIYKDFNKRSNLNYLYLDDNKIDEQIPEIINHYGNLDNFYDAYSKQIYQDSLPMENNIATIIDELQEQLDVRVLTSFKEDKQYTNNWLKKQKIKPLEIIQTDKKHKLKSDYVIAESLGYLFMMQHFSNTTPICYWQKYNRDWPLQDQEIKSLKELPQTINKLKNNSNNSRINNIYK